MSSALSSFKFLAAAFLILLTALTLPHIAYVRAVTPASPGDYLVAESGANNLDDVTPAGGKTVIATGLNTPFGVAVDASRNYIVTEAVGNLVRISPDGGTTTYIKIGLNFPDGVAVDGAGNYIVTEHGTGVGSLDKITPAGTLTYIVSPGGLNHPWGVAIDASGNYIVAETGASNLDKISPAGVITVITTGLAAPEGVAIDASGNYAVTEFGTGKLDIITPAGGVTTIATPTEPVGVAVGISGEYIVAEYGTGNVVRFSPSGSGTATLLTGLSAPQLDAVMPYPSSSSVATATGTGTATLTLQTAPGVLSGGIQSFSAVSPSSLPAPPAGFTFPQGLFSFTLVGLSIGQTVTVTLTLPSPLPAAGFSYWKFHGGTWTQMPAGKATLDATGRVVTLTLTDGASPDDADASANGVIVDPGGPAAGVPAQPTHPLNVGGEMLPVNLMQVLGPWLAVMLVLSVVAVETLVLRGRKNRKH